MSDQLPNEGSPTRPAETPTPSVPETPSHEPPTELPIAPPAPEQPAPVEPRPTQPTPETPAPPVPREATYGNAYSAIPPMSAPREVASNYPRAGLNILGYVRPPGVYWDSIGTAFSMITSNVGPYVLSTLLFAVMLGAVYACTLPFMLGTALASGAAAGSSPGSIPPTMGAGYSLGMIIPQAILQYVLVFPFFGLIAVGVRHAQGNYPQVNDFFIPFKQFKTTWLAALLVAGPTILMTALSGIIQASLATNHPLALLISAAFLILLVPIYLCSYSQLLLSGTAAIFNGNSPIDTAKTLYGRMGWQILLFGLLFIVASIVAGLGFLLFCVGALFTYPILSNVIALHYVYNFPEDQTPTQGQAVAVG